MFGGAAMPGPSASSSLREVIGSLGLTASSLGLQGIYDFGDNDCYSGSGQTITDLSGQGNNLYPGSSSGNATFDPEFKGTAGGRSSAEFFQRNATTGLCAIEGTLPTWAKAVHKSGGKITIVQWAKTTTGTYSFWPVTSGVNSGLTAFVYPAFYFGVGDGVTYTLNKPYFEARRDDGNIAGSFTGTQTVTTGSWLFSACAIDESATSALIQIGGTQSSGSISYTTPSTSNPTNPLTIIPTWGSVTDLACLALWSTALSAAQLTALYQSTRDKFGV